MFTRETSDRLLRTRRILRLRKRPLVWLVMGK